MKVLQQLHRRRTGMQRYDEFDTPAAYDVHCGATGEMRPDTLDRNEEWQLSATLCVTFWANQAKFDTAVKIAERALSHRLYGDVLSELYQLRLAVSNGDRRAAYIVIDRLQNTMEGK